MAARVTDAAHGDRVLASDMLLAQLDADRVAALRTGRAKRLHADGAPRDLRVIGIARPE